MNESISDKGVCRTAPATPGLLKILRYYTKGLLHFQKRFRNIKNKIKCNSVASEWYQKTRKQRPLSDFSLNIFHYKINQTNRDSIKQSARKIFKVFRLNVYAS